MTEELDKGIWVEMGELNKAEVNSAVELGEATRVEVGCKKNELLSSNRIGVLVNSTLLLKLVSSVAVTDWTGDGVTIADGVCSKVVSCNVTELVSGRPMNIEEGEEDTNGVGLASVVITAELC